MHRCILIIFILSITFACSDDSMGPDKKDPYEVVSGQYETSTFKVQLDNSTIDILSVGGFIELTLKKDKTTLGQFFVPDTLGLTEGEDIDYNLEGTYKIIGDTLTFQHEGDTFIRDTKWLHSDGQLSTPFPEVILLKK